MQQLGWSPDEEIRDEERHHVTQRECESAKLSRVCRQRCRHASRRDGVKCGDARKSLGRDARRPDTAAQEPAGGKPVGGGALARRHPAGDFPSYAVRGPRAAAAGHPPPLAPKRLPPPPAPPRFRPPPARLPPS